MTTRKGPMTVECAGGERFAAELKAYVDGELTPLRGAAVRRHLAGCVACRKEVEGMGEITRLLNEGDVPGIAPVGAALRARLIDTMQTEAPGEPERRPVPLWRARPAAVFGTAGAVLAAAGVAFVGMYRPAIQPQSGAASVAAAGAEQMQVELTQAPAAAVASAPSAPETERALRAEPADQDRRYPTPGRLADVPGEVSLVSGAGSTVAAKGAAAQEFKQVAPPSAMPAAVPTGGEPFANSRSRGLNVLAKKRPATEAQARTAAPAAAAAYALEAEADTDARRARQVVPAVPAERQVHREASIGVTVAKVEAASEKVEGIVAATDGGFVARNDLNTATDGAKAADLTLRVPVREFDAVMRQLAALGEVVSKSVRGEDITEKLSDATQSEAVLANEVRDADRRLKVGKLSDRRTTAKEYELRQLKVQHAQVQARLGLLRKMGTLATIEVRLSERPAPVPPEQAGVLGDMGETGRAAALAFQSAVRVPVVLLVWLLALSPVWAPLLIAYRVAARRHAAATGTLTPDR